MPRARPALAALFFLSANSVFGSAVPLLSEERAPPADLATTDPPTTDLFRWISNDLSTSNDLSSAVTTAPLVLRPVTTGTLVLRTDLTVVRSCVTGDPLLLLDATAVQKMIKDKLTLAALAERVEEAATSIQAIQDEYRAVRGFVVEGKFLNACGGADGGILLADVLSQNTKCVAVVFGLGLSRAAVRAHARRQEQYEKDARKHRWKVGCVQGLCCSIGGSIGAVVGGGYGLLGAAWLCGGAGLKGSCLAGTFKGVCAGAGGVFGGCVGAGVSCWECGTIIFGRGPKQPQKLVQAPRQNLIQEE